MISDDKSRRTIVGRGSTLPVVFLGSLLCACFLCPELTRAQLAVLDDNSLSNVTALTRDGSRVRGGASPLVNLDPGHDTDSSGDDSAVAPGVYASGVSARLQSRNEVRVTEQSQSNLRAAALQNASASDFVRGLNVVAMPADIASYYSASLDVAQENRLTQKGPSWASLGFFATLSPSYSSSFLQTESASSFSRHSRRMESIDRLRSVQSTTTRFSATAMAPAPDLFDGLVIGDKDITLDPFTIGPEPFTIPLCGPFGNNCINRQISLPNIRVVGATINTGGVTFPGDAIDGHAIVLAAPVLTIPDLTVRVCLRLAGCDAGGFTELTIPGREIQLLDDFAGPVEGITVFGQGIGFGYAIAGNGEISLEPGNINGALHIDLNRLVDNLSLTLRVLGMEIPLSFLPFSLPEFDVPIDIDIPMNNADQFNVSIDNQACVLSNGDEVCTGLDESNVSTTELVLSEQGFIATEHSQRTRSEAFTRSRDLSLEGEVSAQGAAAKMIVIDHSSVETDSYNLVFFESNSQTDIRALNVENGALGILATGLNITGAHSKISEIPGLSVRNVQQTNVITQIGGL